VLLSQKKEGRVFGTASGAMLAEFAPNSFQNHGLAVSADGRFIAVPSFTAEVKVCVRQFVLVGSRGHARGIEGHRNHRSAVAADAWSKGLPSFTAKLRCICGRAQGGGGRHRLLSVAPLWAGRFGGWMLRCWTHTHSIKSGWRGVACP
jgi:hypothetical protein